MLDELDDDELLDGLLDGLLEDRLLTTEDTAALEVGAGLESPPPPPQALNPNNTQTPNMAVVLNIAPPQVP